MPDGYTLLIIQPSLTINPSMIRKLPYDAVAGRRRRADHDREPCSGGDECEGPDRACQGEAGGTHVRLARCRNESAPGRRALQAHGRSRHAASAFQRLRDGFHQPDVGRGFGRVLHGPVSITSRQERQDARAWRDVTEARCGRAGRADDRGIGVAGIRDFAVVRHTRAGAHAASDRRPVVPSSPARIQQSGRERAPDGSGRGSRQPEAGAIRSRDQTRTRAMGQGHQGGGDQAAVTRVRRAP
ncbi:MAG: hypothetical protein HYY77_03060 [Betaproteobacteria bacterium]|nr:hypothetical protein [Betaproteobacteria bacterium]